MGSSPLLCGSGGLCIISGMREHRFETFFRNRVKNNSRVNFLQTEAFLLRGLNGLNFVSSELDKCQNIFVV